MREKQESINLVKGGKNLHDIEVNSSSESVYLNQEGAMIGINKENAQSLVDAIQVCGELVTQDQRDWIKKGIEIGQIQGVAYAVAEMYRHGDEISIWKAWGMPTLEECRDKYEVAEYDLEILMKHKKELEKD
jgi:hypothetical protein